MVSYLPHAYVPFLNNPSSLLPLNKGRKGGVKVGEIYIYKCILKVMVLSRSTSSVIPACLESFFSFVKGE